MYCTEPAKSRLHQRWLLAPEDTWKTASTERKEERESQSASYRKILCKHGPTDCGFGSVISVALSPANQHCNSILQCKLKFLIPTVRQRGLFIFFLNPTVGHRSQAFSWLLFCCCQFRAGGGCVCLTHTSFKYMQGSVVSKMQKLGTF